MADTYPNFAALEQPEGEPARATGSAFELAFCEIGVMGSLSERLAVGVPPHQVRRGCESFEVAGRQWTFAVGSLEQAAGIRPRSLLVQLPGLGECLHLHAFRCAW